MDSLVDSLLAYRANSPVIDQLLKEAGFSAPGNPVEALMEGTSGGSRPLPAATVDTPT